MGPRPDAHKERSQLDAHGSKKKSSGSSSYKRNTAGMDKSGKTLSQEDIWQKISEGEEEEETEEQ